MRQIKLLSLTIDNFKGIRDLTVDLAGQNGTVSGRNASGKSTIVDAFSWLLFNKDAFGRTDFQIRPVDENGKMVDNIDITVTAVLDINGQAVELSKTQSQKWTKHRGSSAPTFEGNVNTFKVNGFPVSQKEYAERISGIIEEDLFKLLTSPKAFPSMKWQEQRAVLMRMVSDLTDEDVLNTDTELYAPIRDDILAAGPDKAKEKHAGILKKLKEEQKSFPIRIDEASRSIREVDVPALIEKRKSIDDRLEAAKAFIESIARDNPAEKFREKIEHDIAMTKWHAENLRQKAYAEYQKKQSAKRAEISAKESEVSVFIANLTGIERTRDALSDGMKHDINLINIASANYKEANGRRLAANATVCPTCGREFEPDKVEEIRSNFADNRIKDIEKALSNGRIFQKRIDEAKTKIEECTNEISALTEQISKANEAVEALRDEYNRMSEPDMSGNEAYADCLRKIQELEAQLENIDPLYANKEYTETYRTLTEERNQIEAELSIAEANKRATERITELQEAQRENSQMVADEEGIVYALEEFIKAKMNLLSDRINGHFKSVRFKLFDQLINGGMKETCVMQINSNGSYVDFGNCNSAGQTQGGLDVINALSELYGVSAPIFIDNRESCTEIPEVKAQVINLVVSPEDKALRIVKEA